MALLTGLLASQAFVFGGGGTQDLTRTLSNWYQTQTVVLLDQLGSYRGFQMDGPLSRNPKDAARLARARGGIRLLVSGDGVSASRGAYGPEVREGPSLLNGRLTTRGQRLEPIPSNAFYDGKVSLVTGQDGGISLSDLQRQGLSKPLRMHWLYQRVAVSVNAKGVDEPAFLRTVASAVGAKFSMSDEGYRFDFDPVAVRDFAARTAEVEPGDAQESAIYLPYRQVSRRIAALAWREAPLDAVAKAFAKDNGTAAFSPRKSSLLRSLIVEKMRALSQLVRDPRLGSSDREALEMLLGMTDFDGNPRLVIMSDLLVNVAMPRKGGGTVLL